MERKTSHFSLRLDPAVKAAAEKAAARGPPFVFIFDRGAAGRPLQGARAARRRQPAAEERQTTMKPKRSVQLDVYAHGGEAITSRSRIS